MTAHWRERQRPGERPSECQRITIRLGGSRVSRLFGTAQGAAGKPAGPTHRKPAFMTACVPGGHEWLPSFALTGGLPPVVAAFLLFAKPGHPLLASLLLTTRSKRKSPASSSGLPQLRGGPAGLVRSPSLPHSRTMSTPPSPMSGARGFSFGPVDPERSSPGVAPAAATKESSL